MVRRTVRPEQAEYFSFFHVERYIVDRREVAVLLDHVLDLDGERSFGGWQWRTAAIDFGTLFRHYCCPAAVAL